MAQIGTVCMVFRAADWTARPRARAHCCDRMRDLLRDQGARSLIHGAIESDICEQTAGVLNTLSPKEEKVIRMRFGIDFDRGHTLEEVGREFGFTLERARQIEVKALAKLREPQRAQRLRALTAS